MADVLAAQTAADQVNLVAVPIPCGVKYRLEVERGILKALGRLSAMKAGNGS